MYSPSNLAETSDGHGSLLAWVHPRGMATVPNEHRSVDEVILRFVCFENGQLPISECLLRWGDRRVVKRQTDEVNGERRNIFQREAYRGAGRSVITTSNE